MALLLLHRDATVTICHSRTPDLPSICRQADILVAAVGRAGLVTKDFVKPGATVIDVGMNRVTEPAVAAQLFPAGHPYHHYIFQIYALNANLDAPAGATRADVEKAMEGKIIARGAYVGRAKPQ